VSPTGSDANAGTQASPWKTIQKAANTLSAGSTVLVQAGTYNERVNVSRSGSSGNLIVFQAQGAVKTQGFVVQGNYIKVDGFEMVSTGSGWSDRSTGSGVYLVGSNNQISNNYIHHSTAAGIYFTNSASNNLITGNRIAYAVECALYIQGSNNLIVSNDISHTREIGGSDADGIRFFGTGNTVRKNYLHDIKLSDSPGSSPHIDCYQTWGPAKDYLFEQNLCDKSADGHKQGFTMGDITHGSTPVSNITIRNNVFISRGTGYQPDVNTGDSGEVYNAVIVNNTFVAVNGPTDRGIWIFSYQRGITVKNNVLYDHGDSHDGEPYILLESGATGVDISNNALFKSDNLMPTGGCRSGDLCFVNPSVSPGFVNFGAQDFHLSSTSVLIGKGAIVTSVTNDYDGVSRALSVAYDIGAYTYAP